MSDDPHAALAGTGSEPLDAAALAAAWLAAWGGHDAQAFGEICVPGVSYEDPLTQGPLDGTPALGDHARRLWTAFPDVRLEPAGAVLGDGRNLAIPCRLLANHRGELAGLPATGRFVVVHCVFYCELRHARLARVRAFFDLYDAAIQLGVLPSRGTFSEKALLMVRGFGLRARRQDEDE